MIGRQIVKLEDSRNELEEIESRLDSLMENDPPDTDALEEFAVRPMVRRLIGRYAPKQKKEAAGQKSKAKDDIPAASGPSDIEPGTTWKSGLARTTKGTTL